MKVGFTGTSKGMTETQRKMFLGFITSLLNLEQFHHGDCIGADAQAHEIIHNYSKRIQIVIHPPTNPKYRAYCSYASSCWLSEKPYAERNQDIVDVSDLVIACPEGEEKIRSGTWQTIRFAKKAGKDLFIIFPNGEARRS